MKKLHLPLLFTSLLLTGCNVNKPAVKGETITPDIDSNVQVEEDTDVIVETLESEEEVIVSEDKPTETLTSPVYRPGGVTSPDTLNLDIRSYEATITDSGRINQRMDTIYLDYNYDGLEDLGYYWLDITLTLTAREINDGYQYLFLYNTTKCQSVGESLLENFIPCFGDSIVQGMLIKEQFEIGPGYKKTDWEEREFHFFIHVGNMIDNLYIRYGANGFLGDTWVNKDVKVSITPKMSKY